MAAMGSMGSRAHLWLDTLSIALKRVLLMNPPTNLIMREEL
jgi:hypothetical protein